MAADRQTEHQTGTEVSHSLTYDHLYDITERQKATQLSLNHDRQPVSISWSNLTYSVKVGKPKTDKVILHDVSGSAKAGQLVAIMGPSGSGKTTLLNILSGRCVRTKGARLTGHIALNNMDIHDLGSERFAQISAYVQQDDAFFSMQTVEETLTNAARLRLPKEMPIRDKLDRVNSIIQELGLKKAANTRIGNARHRGVSGGERKRTNIAVEMMQDPSLLFLDEPTSGLDAFQALNVMETLKLLTLSGVTVLVSVHQPRSSIFQLFDELILLSEGQVAYQGAAGEHAVKYFGSLGLRCPSLFHPGDYFLDIISVDNRSAEQEAKSRKRIQFILDSHTQRMEESAASNRKQRGHPEDKSMALKLSTLEWTGYAGICEQIEILGKRNLRQIWRDKFTLTLRVFMACFFALFLSALYSDLGNEQKDIQNRNGILFFIAINQSFGSMISTLNVFIGEKVMVMRERQAHCYYLWIYYFTKMLTQTPVDLMVPAMFASILYWIVGLNPDPLAFLMFVFLTVLISLSAVGIGAMVGSFAPNIDAANAMAPLIMILMILFGGFYINSDSMPSWLGWLENVSTIKWVFYAYCVNEYTGLDLECDDIGAGTGCLETGEEVLELLSFDDFGVWIPTAILAGLLVTFHVIAFSCLTIGGEKYMECQDPSVLEKEEMNGHYGSSSNGHYGGSHEMVDQDLKVRNSTVKIHQKTPLLKT